MGSSGDINFNDNQLTITQATGDLAIGAGNLLVGSAAKTIQFASPIASSAPMMTMFPSGTQNYDRMVISHSSAYPGWGLQYQDTPDKFNFISGGIPVLTADLGGQKVGIGTSSPALGKLVVEGLVGNTVAVFRGSPTSRGISLVADYPGVYFNAYWNAGTKAMAPGYAGLLNFDPVLGNIYLANSSASSANAGDPAGFPNSLLMTKNGDVGIGTSTPAGRLQVIGRTYTNELRVGGEKGAAGYVAAINGRLIATEVRVELLSNWPDYVFKKGYELMPIENLEAKIKAENHLPGIPAAGEIKESGIMLGEMQTKTIEKVEENTLYIIQLNNKIKLLEKKIDELTKRKK